ncbi:putative reverse transcriptase domain-containing protein [Tanacetum coccineum]
MAMMIVVAPSIYTLAPPSGTPPLLPILLPTPSPPLLLPFTDHRSDMLKIYLPPQKRLCIAPDPRYEVRESSSAPRPIGGFRTDYGFVATLDAKIRRDPERDFEREARLSRVAWGRSMATSDVARSEIMALRTTVLGQKVEIAALRVIALQGQQGPVGCPAQPEVSEEAGVADALAARDADRSMNGDDYHNSGTGVRRKLLLLWFERMETGLLVNVAHAMTWTNLKKKMTDKYCPRGEIKKLEVGIWNLKVKGTDVVSYNQHFQELALMCARMFPEESDKIEKYDAIEFATELMDKKIRTFAERQSENKRKQDDNQQQQQNKRQNTGRAYVAGSGEKKPYGGSKPLYSKCNYYHDGQCAPKCHKCNRVGHLARDCRSTTNSNTANNQRGIGASQKPTCYECGA